MTRIAVFVFLLMLTGQAQAVRMTDLYEAAVPVANQDPASRVKALRDVLHRVITKVTGQRVIPANLLQASTRVEHMVEQFGYETREQPGNGRRQLYLWAKLNQAGVQQLIRQSGQPIWPEERPATLVWLAVEDKNGRLILAEDSIHPVMQTLRQVADERGLPIVLPLMDLQESSVISFESITTMRDDSLKLPSDKYGSSQVLIGFIQQVDGGLWRGRWKMMGEGERIIAAPSGLLSDTIKSGINPLASRIAQQFSSYSFADSEQYIELAVDDINGAADYARVLKYLQSLSLVSDVEVVGVDQQAMSFRLHTRVDMAAVLQTIQLGKILYPRESIDRLVFGLNP